MAALETERLVGEPASGRHRDDAVALFGDPRVADWIWPSERDDSGPRTPEQASALIDRFVAHWREHGFGMWYFRERGSGERPDAVFAANDLLAMGVLQAFNMLGSVRVPDDIALIGYDDIDFASAAVVPLSSIRQPASLIGYTAVDLLLKEAASGGESSPEQVVFQPELVVRESTRRSAG